MKNLTQIDPVPEHKNWAYSPQRWRSTVSAWCQTTHIFPMRMIIIKWKLVNDKKSNSNSRNTQFFELIHWYLHLLHTSCHAFGNPSDIPICHRCTLHYLDRAHNYLCPTKLNKQQKWCTSFQNIQNTLHQRKKENNKNDAHLSLYCISSIFSWCFLLLEKRDKNTFFC